MTPKVGDIIIVKTKGREWYGGITPYENLRGKVKRVRSKEYFIMDLLPDQIKYLKERGYHRYKSEGVMVPYWACVIEKRWQELGAIMEVE